MDPASAIGVASAALTFVDFGVKIVKGAVHLHRAGDVDGDVSEDIAIKFDALAKRLQPPKGVEPSPEQEDLLDLATSCQSLSQDFADTFRSLQPADFTSKRQCMWSAVKHRLKEKEVLGMEKRLETCRRQFETHLLHENYLARYVENV